MTDFFGDLEQELRGAHPRRPRPVVPVRPVVLAVAVLAAIVAVASFVPAGEQEAVQQPPADQSKGTVPLDCRGGRVVDGTIPGEILDRFAILRGDVEPVTLPDDQLPPNVAEVVRQSVRTVDGPRDTRYAFFVARLHDDRCRAGEVGVCLISLDSRDGLCAVPGRQPFEENLVRGLGDGRDIAAVMAEDGISSSKLSAGGPEIDVEGNVGFAILPEQQESITPLGCASEPDMAALEKRFAIFREPRAKGTDGIQLALPDGYQSVYMTEARVAEFPLGVRYVVVPVGDDGCQTRVCLVRMGLEKTACAAPEEAAIAVTLVTRLEGRTYAVAGLVADGVDSLDISSTTEPGGITDTLTVPPQGSVFYATVEAGSAGDITVEPGS